MKNKEVHKYGKMWKEERKEEIMRITIVSKDNNISIRTDEAANAMEVLQKLFSAQLAVMENVMNKVPEEHKEEIKGDLFDKYNYAASNVLDMFAPEIALRPNLTEKAILKAENELLEKQV